MVSADGVLTFVGQNWLWLVVIAVVVWYLRWWTEAKQWGGRSGGSWDFLGRQNPISVFFIAIRRELDQNVDRLLALIGGVSLLLFTFGDSITLFLQYDATTWISFLTIGFATVRILGFDIPLYVLLSLATFALVVTIPLRNRRRRRLSRPPNRRLSDTSIAGIAFLLLVFAFLLLIFSGRV